jgi:hypothetical protein
MCGEKYVKKKEKKKKRVLEVLRAVNVQITAFRYALPCSFKDK